MVYIIDIEKFSLLAIGVSDTDIDDYDCGYSLIPVVNLSFGCNVCSAC